MEALEKHAVYLVRAGVRPLLAGTMGEGLHLARGECATIIHSPRRALDRESFLDVPIIVGAGGSSMRETIVLCEEVAAAGADAVIVIMPGYFAGVLANHRRALKEFYTEVAEKSPVPVMIYNCASLVSLPNEFSCSIQVYAHIDPGASLVPKARKWTPQKMPMRFRTPTQPITRPHGMLPWVRPQTGTCFLFRCLLCMMSRLSLNPPPLPRLRTQLLFLGESKSLIPVVIVTLVPLTFGGLIFAFGMALVSCFHRLNFTCHSIAYMFRTMYTPADALTIAALVAYMNAVIPPDKHEEFDMAEVMRAAKMLHDRGNVAL